jgi:hypothetical protein
METVFRELHGQRQTDISQANDADHGPALGEAFHELRVMR